MQVRLERKALPDDCLPHLLLRFESNGSHRHSRVAPFLFSRGRVAPLTTSLPPADARVALRRELRARRRAIKGKDRILAARRVARLIESSPWLQPGRRIGLYLAMPEEREDLQKAAALLATRLKEIREAGKVIGTERSLVMVALNMANELAKLQTRDEHRGAELGTRVKQMRERVERALVQGQQLEL